MRLIKKDKKKYAQELVEETISDTEQADAISEQDEGVESSGENSDNIENPEIPESEGLDNVIMDDCEFEECDDECDEECSEEECEDIQDESITKKKTNLLGKRSSLTLSFSTKKRIKKILAKITTIIIWAIGIILVYFCTSNAYQQVINPFGYTGFFGIGEAIVASESMVPTLNKNDLIFYKSVPHDEIQINDIVIYEKESDDGEILIVHRVLEIGDGYVVTQGDNNASPDEAFPTSDIVGRYLFKISGIGWVLQLFSANYAPLLILILLSILIAFRIAFFVLNKKRMIKNISHSKETRDALNHFFDM